MVPRTQDHGPRRLFRTATVNAPSYPLNPLTREVVMLTDAEPIDAERRARLCNRENADRVAEQLCQATLRRVAVLRTGSALQPYRVTDDPAPSDGTVEMEVVVL